MEYVVKIVTVIIGILILAGLAAIVRFLAFLFKNGKPRNPSEEVYDGDEEKKALIIYQPSPHKTVDIMAKKAALALNEKGYTVVMNYPSDKLTYNLDQYQVICFGSAVFIGAISAALTKYIKRHSFSGKRVFLFLVGKELEEKSELEKLEGMIGAGNAVSKVKVMKGKEALVEDIISRQF